MSTAIPSANELYADNIRQRLRILFSKYRREMDSNNYEAKNTEKMICKHISIILEHALFEFVTYLSVEQITTILREIDFQTVKDYEVLIPRLIKSSCQNKQLNAFEIVSAINFSNLNFDINAYIDFLRYFNPLTSFTTKLTDEFDQMNSIPATDYEYYKSENTKLKQQIQELKLIKGSYFTPIRKCPQNFRSDIFKAISEGDLKSVQYLYEHMHIDIEAKNIDGNTPLLYAVSRGKKYISRYLIENADADLHAKNKYGRNILHLACANGRSNLLEHLLDAYGLESSLNDKDLNGNTPLHRAAYFGKSVKTIQILLKRNADKYKKNNFGQTPYDVACDGKMSHPNYSQIKELLRF